MSGVMLKVAVYGFIRFVFDLIGGVHWQWGVAVLAVGSVSALMGVLYALMQHDLKRLLAYHSVENIGIIFIGLGLSLLFLGTGHTVLGVLGLVAACFLVGCVSISALPPFNGFVSEWLTFQTALQAWSLDSGVLRSLVPIVAATLALTGALAAACFVKVYGVAFLGRARSRHVRRARQVPAGMQVAQGMLAFLCLFFGVFPTSVVAVLDVVPVQLLGHGLPQAAAHGGLWLTPVAPATASYSAPLVVLMLAAMGGLVAFIWRRGAARRVRRCDPWDCGFARPTPRMQYTATAFAQPIRRVYAMLFHIEEGLEVQPDGVVRHFLRVGDRAWDLLYAPVVSVVESAARRVARIQSGNVRIYLGWTLATLVVLLWIIS
jgi:NADH:ubiquinone oxidoreductase subunit 5 (subunit L)/multisubunit Na+/H+ antiporter MnhA subunit